MDLDPNFKEGTTNNISPLEKEVIDFFVDGVRVLGLPKSLGEIYGMLFISVDSLSLDDLVFRLGISKGSASQGLRMLKALGAVREAKGHVDRRTYYEPAVDLKRLVGGFVREQIRPHLDSGRTKLDSIYSHLQSTDSIDNENFYLDRIRRLDSWMSRTRKILPIIQKILGE